MIPSFSTQVWETSKAKAAGTAYRHNPRPGITAGREMEQGQGETTLPRAPRLFKRSCQGVKYLGSFLLGQRWL